MESSFIDGVEDDEHNGVGFPETSRIFVMQDELYSGTEPFGREYNKNFEFQQLCGNGEGK